MFSTWCIVLINVQSNLYNICQDAYYLVDVLLTILTSMVSKLLFGNVLVSTFNTLSLVSLTLIEGFQLSESMLDFCLEILGRISNND